MTRSWSSARWAWPSRTRRDVVAVAAGEQVAFQLAEVRVGAALRDDVDRARTGVADRSVARARRDLEVLGAVEDQRVDELVGEGVGVVDAFVLEAFLVLTATAQNGVAAGIERGARDRREQVGFVGATALAEHGRDLRWPTLYWSLVCAGWNAPDGLRACRAPDVLKRLVEADRYVDRLPLDDRHAGDGVRFVPLAGKRDGIGVRRDAADGKETVLVGRGRVTGGRGNCGHRNAGQFRISLAGGDGTRDVSGRSLREGRRHAAQHERQKQRKRHYAAKSGISAVRELVEQTHYLVGVGESNLKGCLGNAAFPKVRSPARFPPGGRFGPRHCTAPL